MRRILYFCVIAFWLLMSLLLIQSEFGELHTAGVPIPPEVVWKKMIQATDPSLLAVTLHGPTNRIGSFKWVPSLVETNEPVPPDTDQSLPEGMSQGVSNYLLDFDGSLSLTLDGWTNRVRVSMRLKTDTNAVWQEFHLQVGLRPEIWTFEADAAKQTLRVRTDGSAGSDEKVYAFKDLADSRKWMRQLGGLMLPELIAGLSQPSSSAHPLGFELEARRDHRLKFGAQRIRCFRLRASILGRYHMDLYLNPQSGEVIRVDLPNQIALMNESFL